MFEIFQYTCEMFIEDESLRPR